LKDLKGAEEQLLEERLKFVDGLKDIFTQKQIAEYIIFERNFNQNLRDLMKDIAKERWNQRNR
jgi:hypothetical protein